MLKTYRRGQYLSRICASCLLALDLGGLAAKALSHSPFVSWPTRTVVGDPFSLIAGDRSRQATWDCGATIDVAVNFGEVSVRDQELLLEDVRGAVRVINRSATFRFRLVGLTDAIPTRSWGINWRRHELRVNRCRSTFRMVETSDVAGRSESTPTGLQLIDSSTCDSDEIRVAHHGQIDRVAHGRKLDLSDL